MLTPWLHCSLGLVVHEVQPVSVANLEGNMSFRLTFCRLAEVQPAVCLAGLAAPESPPRSGHHPTESHLPVGVPCGLGWPRECSALGTPPNREPSAGRCALRCCFHMLGDCIVQ
jgi:hypothetical protein